MHQAVAERTQNSGSHPTGGGLRRLSVYADSIRVDLALPAAVPIGSLIPPIVESWPAEASLRTLGRWLSSISFPFRATSHWTRRRHWPR